MNATRILRPRLAVAFLLLTGVSSASADELDKVLAGNARGLVAQLAEKKVANVGVLKFEVQKAGPEGPVYPNLGRLTETLPTRLENALILAIEEKNQIGIIRDAGRVAADADPAANYRTADARAKLFAHKYPLAWGSEKVPATVLLVGRVRFDPPMKTATVVVRGFASEKPGEWFDLQLRNAEVPVTRELLADVDQPFVVAPEFFRKRGSDTELADPLELSADSAAMPIETGRKGSLGRTPETKPEATQPPPPPPSPKQQAVDWLDDLVELKLYYDGKPVARKADGNFPPPKPGQKVHFTIKSTERIGVVLLVNGINTADYDRSHRDVNSYTKWVLDPKKEYWVRGYYTEKEVFPFAVTSREQGEKRLSELAAPDKVGQIEVHVYKEIRDEMLLAHRGLNLSGQTGSANSLADLKQDIRAKILSASAPVKKSLIIPGDGEKVGKIDTAEFIGTLAAKVVLSYTDAAKPDPIRDFPAKLGKN